MLVFGPCLRGGLVFPSRYQTTLELSRRGYRVTGVDRTESYLGEARRRSDDQGLEVEWVRADMRSFARPEAFDVVLNMYTSFGYFEDAADDRLAAQAFLNALVPGVAC